MDTLIGLLTIASQLFPDGLIYLAGAILALSHRKSYPTASRLTLFAVAIFFLESLVNIASVYMAVTLRDWGWNNGQLMFFFYPVTRIAEFLLKATAWGLILAAIFGGRSKL